MREPIVPTQPLPELADFLAPFRVHFKRAEGPAALERYLTGLLAEVPIKNCDTLAQIVPGTASQRLQGFLTEMLWDHDDLNRQRVQRLLQLHSEGDAVLIFDDTGFAKQGRCSVGVQRQYSGTLGRTGNCQIAGNCHYAERTLAWPVATRLYLPKQWADDAARRTRAHVPPEVVFQTKPQIALALLDAARAQGIPHACVTADADYGDNCKFLDGLDLRRERCVVAVRSDFAVVVRRGAAVEKAAALIAAQPGRAWRVLRWREGSRDWLRSRCVGLRCWRVDEGGGLRPGWLIGEDGSDGKRRYYWSNYGATKPLVRLVEYAHRRHWVEQFHEEAKGLLGWDQYQGRLWQGFHRHAVSVLLAYSFLVWREYQGRAKRTRRGPTRRAFSPSAGSAAGVTGGGRALDQRLATG